MNTRPDEIHGLGKQDLPRHHDQACDFKSATLLENVTGGLYLEEDVSDVGHDMLRRDSHRVVALKVPLHANRYSKKCISRFGANSAQIRQSRPDSTLGLSHSDAKVLKCHFVEPIFTQIRNLNINVVILQDKLTDFGGS